MIRSTRQNFIGCVDFSIGKTVMDLFESASNDWCGTISVEYLAHNGQQQERNVILFAGAVALCGPRDSANARPFLYQSLQIATISEEIHP